MNYSKHQEAKNSKQQVPTKPRDVGFNYICLSCHIILWQNAQMIKSLNMKTFNTKLFFIKS